MIEVQLSMDEMMVLLCGLKRLQIAAESKRNWEGAEHWETIIDRLKTASKDAIRHGLCGPQETPLETKPSQDAAG